MSSLDKLREQNLATYLDKLAARTSTPGGGAVAAVVAAEACSLVAMVANFSKDATRKRYRGSRSGIHRKPPGTWVIRTHWL